MNNTIIRMMKEAEKQEWLVTSAVASHDPLEYIVIVFRNNAPFKDRQYSVHRYDAYEKTFFSGTYDLTRHEAQQLLIERL